MDKFLKKDGAAAAGTKRKSPSDEEPAAAADGAGAAASEPQVPGAPTPQVPGAASPSKGVTEEQRKRAAENKAKAEAKLAESKAKKQKTESNGKGKGKAKGKKSKAIDVDADDDGGDGDAESPAAADGAGAGDGDGAGGAVDLASRSPAEIFGALEDLLDGSWRKELATVIGQPYFKEIKKHLVAETKTKNVIFPPAAKVFAAFNYCPFDAVRVVIIGQDPYHGPGQAEGLCFSVAKGVAIPSSLNNIFKELGDDLGKGKGKGAYTKPKHGSLVAWAKQGVLLLNALLTVQQATPMAHKAFGWEKFTDAVIDHLNKRKSGLVFLLWGKPAQQKGKKIDTKKHHVLTAAHPSGLSASKGFYGCKHFSQCNALLKKAGLPTVNWQT